ncbi:MAG: oligosaccharide flippase family protein [Croceivirga sp.]
MAKEKNMASLLANMSAAFLGLVSFMLLARQLNKNDFGHWVLFITLATFFDLLRFGLTRTSSVRLLSNANDDGAKKILGTCFKINSILLLGITIGCYMLIFILGWLSIEIGEGYRLFLMWYPVLGIANLSWNNAMGLFEARQEFSKMMYVRIANVGLFVTFLMVNGIWLNLDLYQIIWVYLVVNLISSLWCTLKKWDGLWYLGKHDKTVQAEIIGFGKYSMGTLIGSSLLRSADTFIIGLSPFMGAEAIAMYAIPIKLTDLLGIPLRSFTMTAYPKMSKKFIQQDLEGVKRLFYQYTGVITLLFMPIAFFCYVLAEYLILFLGGGEYLQELPLLIVVFRIFTLYTLLLPLDRLLGVLMDSINRPKLNLIKVLVMTIANILLDLLAVFIFESLVMVAIGTVAFTVIGILLGIYMLKREIGIKSGLIWTESLAFCKNLKLGSYL